MFYAMLMLYALYLLATDTGRFLKIALALLALAWIIGRLRGVRFCRRPGLIARWREESRRMAEAEADGDDDEDQDEEEVPFCDVADDGEDEAFCGIDREKEIARLEKALNAMYTRRDRMLYTYGCMDRGTAANDRAKLENTKAWRGLEFDITYTEKRLEMLKGE